MLLRSLDVQNFRSVRQAKVTFGRGLNVIYGPNELGKSTLMEALRAGFLLPVESKAAEEFAPWGMDLIPRVAIEFETQPAGKAADELEQSANPAIVWRITKTFGKGARGSTLLERVTGNSRVVQEARGRDVEGRLRELLAWGIPVPGGKGAPRGVPESYLTTALLGEQDKVASIFPTSLDSDGTDSGRTLLTEALGALAQEPITSVLLDRLAARTREVFTDTGQRRRTNSSPLVRRAEEINRHESHIQALQERVRRSDEIEGAIQSLSEKRNEAEEYCRRTDRELELSKAVLDSAKQLALATEQQRDFQQAEAELQTAEAELATSETALSAAAATLQSVTYQLQTAREEVTRSVTKRDQLRASTETSREAKRSTLHARRDEADRSIVSANQLIESARQLELQRAELKQAEQQLQQFHTDADRMSQLFVLVRLRDQQEFLQAAEAALDVAEEEFLKQDALHQAAATAFQTLDAQWQAARQQVASLSAKRDQLRATTQTARESRRATFLARRDEATRDAELARDCLEAARSLAAQQAEVTEAEQQQQEAREAEERARDVLIAARLESERLQLMELWKAQQAARQEYADQKASVDQTQSETKRRQDALDAAQRQLQSDKEALEQARNKAREDQFRRETLQASRLRSLAEMDRARNDLALVRAASDNSKRLIDAKREIDDLTSQRAALEDSLSNQATELERLASVVRRLNVICVAVLLSCAGALTAAVILSDWRALFGTLAALTGIAGALLFVKRLKSQKTLEFSTADRDQRKEQRSEIVTKCLMAQSNCDAAQRDWNHASQQISATFESLEAAADQAPERLRIAQAESTKIEDELRNLESLSEPSAAVPSQQLKSGSELFRDLEEWLATNRQNLDEARQDLFAAEARMNAADKAFEATSVGQEMTSNRDREGAVTFNDLPPLPDGRGSSFHKLDTALKSDQSAPTVAEAEEQDRQAHDNRTAADGRVLMAAERLADREARHAELFQTCARPAEQMLAAATLALNGFATELENLDSTVMSEVDAADRECEQAEANESQLSRQRELAKSAAESVLQSLNNARALRDDRCLRFETAHTTAVKFSSRDREEAVNDNERPLSDSRGSLRHSLSAADTVDLAAIERAIHALRANDDERSNSSRPTLDEAEAQERQSRQTLADADNSVRLATQRLTDRDAQHTQLVAHFDQPAEHILAAAEQTRCLVESELQLLDTNATAEVDAAEREQQQAQSFEKQLSEQQTQAKAAAETAPLAVAAARQSRDERRIRSETLRPRETALGVGAAQTLLADARRELERDFAVPDASEARVSELELQHTQWSATLQVQTQKLYETRGQLGLVGGAVVREQLEQERDVLDRLRASTDDLEQDYQATQHLLDLLKQADSKHAAHLGRSLAKPVAEQFLKLTGGRYSDVLLAPNLSLQKVVANNGERDLTTLSVGVRDQLATLIRLSLAAYLKTTLVLDDQLAHSDPHRLLWFRERLRASVEDSTHQIIVITCRPLDYLEPRELPPPSSPAIAIDGSLTVVDLALLVSHQ